MPVKKKAKVSAKAPAKKEAKNENKMLKRLEKDIVSNQEKKTEADFEDEERKVIEDKRQALEGMGIEKEEDAGQEPYPEIEEALKDPEEEEDEDKL